MPVARRLSVVMVTAILAVAVAVSAEAQGKSGNAPGKNKPKPPSTSTLPGATSAAATASPLATVTGASPLAWLDDASVLEPGSVLLTMSGTRWSGGGVSELYLPVIDASFGVTKRVQISATVPRVAGGDDGTGAPTGLGTSYFSAKIALRPDSTVKLAVSPLIEVLGTAATQWLAPDESRYQLGVPVSIEAGRGPARLFGAAGFFTRGAWFAGGGAAFQLKPELGASVSLTRSWAKTDFEGVRRARSELSGGASYFLTGQIAVYGSLGHTIATSEENGAGMTIGAGVTFFFVPETSK